MKKLLHALIIDQSYDREILISWDNCLAFGMIPNTFPLPDSESDSDENGNKDHNQDEQDNNENIKSDTDQTDTDTDDNQPDNKNRRTKEDKNPEMFQKVINEAISKIEDKEKEE